MIHHIIFLRSFLLGTLLLGLAGCVNPQTRAQSADDVEREKDLDVYTIGQVTEVANVAPTQVSGIGIVTGLEGTGHSPTGAYRTLLEQQLRKQKVENVKALLDSPNNALVLVTGFIPAGVRKGEPIDLEVQLPQNSKATSLRGGYLQYTYLRDYESTRTLQPKYEGAAKLLPGHILAFGRGPLLVGFGNPDEAGELRRGRIWGGGICNIERPLALVLEKKEDKLIRIANAVADRINVMYQDDVRKQQIVNKNAQLILVDGMAQQINDKEQGANPLAGGVMAKAGGKEVIHVRLPHAYRFNAERYLRVVRLIPLREAQEQQGRYRRRLQKMLLEPQDTLRAALRLEALGKESIPALKAGLASEHPLVRFASAEALAYLGSTTGVQELAKLAEYHCEVRLYCLMALSSLDEGICRTKLSELLTAEDTELRCGAFRALRLLDESERRLYEDLGGELLNGSFWLHKVAPRLAPLVHFALGKKAEIVLFGEDIRVLPVKVLAGSEYAVSVEQGDDRCTISRITTNGVTRKQCTLQLESVLYTMADMGAGYPEVVDLLRKLDDRQALSCRIAANALPSAPTVESLAESARDPGFMKDEPRPRRSE